VAVLCQLAANGLTTANPGANDQWKPGYEALPTQVRWCVCVRGALAGALLAPETCVQCAQCVCV
jgi:hypothetical protein